jgi:hypothetical protein
MVSGVVGQGLRSRRHIDPRFHDLRGTAVVRLAIAGATVPQIRTFTGHYQRDFTITSDAPHFETIPKLSLELLSSRRATNASEVDLR